LTLRTTTAIGMIRLFTNTMAAHQSSGWFTI